MSRGELPGTPGASGFYAAGRAGALSPSVVPGSTQANVVGTGGDALLVLAGTDCPSGTGLMVFYINAPPGTATWLQRGPSGQAGVVAAVPFDQPGVVEAVPHTP